MLPQLFQLNTPGAKEEVLYLLTVSLEYVAHYTMYVMSLSLLIIFYRTVWNKIGYKNYMMLNCVTYNYTYIYIGTGKRIITNVNRAAACDIIHALRGGDCMAKEVWLLYQICPITTMVSRIPIVERDTSRNYRYLVVKIHSAGK